MLSSSNPLYKLSNFEPIIKNNKPAIIGNGSYAKIRLMKNKINGIKYAVKEINISKVHESELVNIEREIKLHRSFNHPNIIKFYEYHKNGDFVYLILEYAERGDLFTYINKNKVGVKDISIFYKQICEGFQYIHSKNVIHRDLKPENILLDDNLNVKICDFGWSAEYYENIKRETFCGTYEYMAPEVLLKKSQTNKTDIWSLGVLLYEMTHLKAPFPGRSLNEVIDSINKNIIKFKKTVDINAKKLIISILKLNPKDRPSIDTILNHQFITQTNNTTYSSTKKNITQLNFAFNSENKTIKILKDNNLLSNVKRKLNFKENN